MKLLCTFLLLFSVVSVSAQQASVSAGPIELVLGEGGTFKMGSNDSTSNEWPVHDVTLRSFMIGKYEVTQRQWRDIMGPDRSHDTDCDNCPVEYVSWDDMQEFLRDLNMKYPDHGYRLPTEAEWEYAARGGANQDATEYSGGNQIGVVAWYAGNGGDKTHPVGKKRPNGLGLYDMSGNVWEWCSDWYGENYYAESPQDNPKGPSSGDSNVLRGGSSYFVALGCRVALRSSGAQHELVGGRGFRVVASR